MLNKSRLSTLPHFFSQGKPFLRSDIDILIYIDIKRHDNTLVVYPYNNQILLALIHIYWQFGFVSLQGDSDLCIKFERSWSDHPFAEVFLCQIDLLLFHISDRKLVSSSALLAKVSSNDDKDCKTYRKELQRYRSSFLAMVLQCAFTLRCKLYNIIL